MVRNGTYRHGKMHGRWSRYFDSGEQELFAGELAPQFRGPFVSEATFVDGLLEGTWTIKSVSNRQKVVEWQFTLGRLDGKCVFFFPGGQRRLEANYRNGQLEGTARQWDQQGRVTAETTYVGGRMLAQDVQLYDNGAKRYEGTVLRGRKTEMPEADWWKGMITVAALKAPEPDVRQGRFTVWYPNGQREAEGEYQGGSQVGNFTSWWDNGQKQCEGSFQDGRKEGQWVTWHVNGQRESVCRYQHGATVEQMRWNADGRLADGNVIRTAQAITTSQIR
jgi:antitoxin component YwqK of YwqJK toxin-antitoxin module